LIASRFAPGRYERRTSRPQANDLAQKKLLLLLLLLP